MWRQLNRTPKVLYHYTKRENLESILRDGEIKKFKDSACWFTESAENCYEVMKATVMNEGSKYGTVAGGVAVVGKFEPTEYVLLKLEPRYDKSTDWYMFEQSGSDLAVRISYLKVGYKGNLKFKNNVEVIEVTDFLKEYE